MNLPLVVWLPLGATLVSCGAFVALLWLSWDHAPEGQRWEERYAWAASWAVVGVVASGFLTLMGVWWWAGPL